VAGHASTTAQRWRASCSCCTPAAAGATYRPSLATARAIRRGGGCGPGRPPECGNGSTSSCSTSCPKPSCSTGRARASTRCRCAQKKGSELTGPNPVDRGKPGSKYHLLVDATGLPLHVLCSAANTHDSKMFEPLLATNPSVRGHRHQPGRPRCRRYLYRRGIKVRIARRDIEDKTKLGRHRWVVERTVSWLLRFKRLGLRYDRTEATLRPLLLLAVSLINLPAPRLRDRVVRPGLRPTTAGFRRSGRGRTAVRGSGRRLRGCRGPRARGRVAHGLGGPGLGPRHRWTASRVPQVVWGR
jgi:transposase